MTVNVVLTDIEGTTTSIAFVKDVLFPFSRTHLRTFLAQHGEEPEVREHVRAVAAEAGVNEGAAADVLLAWIDEDRKATPIKALQGRIWRQGYADGTLKAHVYPDAVKGLERLHAAGVRLAVYSSGSVPAQKLLFAHTTEGDLSPWFDAWFDTSVGPKREAESYRRITAELDTEPSRILFLSDVEAELDAAEAAELRTLQLVRPEDGTIASSRHPTAATFDAVLPEVK